MLKAIRTNKLLNIMILVSSIILAPVWYITRHELTLYLGVCVGIYWSTFWWLQIMEHSRRARDHVYQNRIRLQAEMEREVRESRLPLRKRLMGMSQVELVRDLLKSHISHSILWICFSLYITAMTLMLAYHSGIMIILLWIVLCACAIGFLLSVINVIYYMLELRGLRRDIACAKGQ
ncbi:hypothetical protein LCGC14_0479700 [marine sediment metagenome]|uniref:Uncharacterized protein n=1 Tax=marine sediment metagenome TaxID=412755 RepID=A0A0F9SF42_9ZZZZ